VPTGGVTPDTAAAFLKAGSVALGAGSSLVSKEILQSRDWPALTPDQRAKACAHVRESDYPETGQHRQQSPAQVS